MKLKKQLCKLMKNNNYSIIRQKKHYVWGHDYLNCPNIVTSKTPSDLRVLKNVQKQINHSLSLAA
jgi:hypothetical protein